MLALTKCSQCLPKVIKPLQAIETVSYLNMRKKSSIDKILKQRNSESLLIAHPTQWCSDAFQQVKSAYAHVYVIRNQNYENDSIDVPNSRTTFIPSRPHSNSFLEDLEDVYFRGRLAVVVLDPKDPFQSVYFDSHVIGMIGAHKNMGICRNLRLGAIQMVDWNPDWMLSPWTCSKIWIEYMGSAHSSENVLTDSVKERAHTIALSAVKMKFKFSDAQKYDVAYVAALKEAVRNPGANPSDMMQAVRKAFKRL